MILYSSGLRAADFEFEEDFDRAAAVMIGLSVLDVNGRSIGRIQRLNTETMEMDVVLMDYQGLAYYTKDATGTAVPVTATVTIPDATLWTKPMKLVPFEDSGFNTLVLDNDAPEYQLTADLHPVTIDTGTVE